MQQRLFAPKGNIVADQLVRLSGEGAADKCPNVPRRVEALRDDTSETLVFVTNLPVPNPRQIMPSAADATCLGQQCPRSLRG